MEIISFLIALISKNIPEIIFMVGVIAIVWFTMFDSEIFEKKRRFEA